MTATRYTAVSLFPDLVADKYIGPLPKSVQTGTNADLVHQFRTVYFSDDRDIIDLTGPGPGGHNIATPKRARRAHSKLLVFTWQAIR